MDICSLGGSDDGGGVYIDSEAGDVLCDRAAEELHVLWNVPYRLPQLLRGPLIKCCTIQTHFASEHGPYAGQRPHQSRLSAAACPDDP